MPSLLFRVLIINITGDFVDVDCGVVRGVVECGVALYTVGFASLDYIRFAEVEGFERGILYGIAVNVCAGHLADHADICSVQFAGKFKVGDVGTLAWGDYAGQCACRGDVQGDLLRALCVCHCDWAQGDEPTNVCEIFHDGIVLVDETVEFFFENLSKGFVEDSHAGVGRFEDGDLFLFHALLTVKEVAAHVIECAEQGI